MQAFSADYLRIEKRLHHRISVNYPLRKECVRLANRDAAIYAVQSPDKVLEQSIRQEAGPRSSTTIEPYWAEHWSSAYALDNEIERIAQRYPHWFRNEPSMIELGCGGGVLSTALAMRGLDVVATDYSPHAMLLTRLNAAANRVKLRTRRLDWNRLDVQQRFKIVIASDVCYDRHVFATLHDAIRTLVEEDGLVILAEPHRSMGDDFIDLLLRNRWNVRIHEASSREPSHKAASVGRSARILVARPFGG